MTEGKSWEEQLSLSGYRLTKNRRLILDALIKSEGWISASSLHQQLQREYPQIIFSTVYRNLEKLSGLGLLCRIDRDNTGLFEYHFNDSPEHHHHLICRACGKVEVLDFCPLEQENSQAFHGFSDLECHFEVYGRCKACKLPDLNTANPSPPRCAGHLPYK